MLIAAQSLKSPQKSPPKDPNRAAIAPELAGYMQTSARREEQRPASDDAGETVNPGTKGAYAMKLLNIFKSFKNDESGAVTVDWVVLTAAIVGLGMVVMTTVGGGIEGLGAAIVTDLEGRAAGYENQ
jgi:Flp pilus assembly pilin Flp